MTQPASGPALSDGMPLRPFVLCGGIIGLFTGRHGGVSADPFGTLNLSQAVGDDPAAVSRNRRLVLRATAPGPSRLAWMHQVHGAEVAYAPAGTPARAPGPRADAMFTDSPAVAIGALVADCAPVLIGDPVARLVGAAHAGRPGLVAGVVPALVRAMCEAGGQAARMRAAIGPAICGGCYEVPAQMRDQVAAAVPESACVTRKGTPGIDVRAGVLAQLASLGVAATDGDSRCTAESGELFSYRRDGWTGRFAGLIWLAP
ncbi:MAG TPA: peptidoglycan editing factor PgeF [Streptosporangiaceae bacterium]|nr:peptidoglycan editing factor PgeF [Streptosporangiaceae bacterium]